MKYYMKEYIEKVDTIIENNDKKNIDKVIEEHLIKIKFFMHERLIHLLVTILFALMTLITFFVTIYSVSFGLILLFFLFLALLIPYIYHYYYLENNVQYMYKQYDKLVSIRDNKNSK